MAGRGDDIIKSRLEKLERVKAAGVNPFPAKAQRIETIDMARQMKEGTPVTVVGRLTAIRGHGGSFFADLIDFTGSVQLFFKKDVIGDQAYEFTDNFDIGDFLNVTGTLFKTQAGELTIEVTSFALLTKAVRAIPSEHYGIKDTETRLRKRYLDLLMNPEVRELFVKKSHFWQNVRSFLVEKGFLEVETPALELIPGGAEARPFITHHNAQDIDLYLRISLELYQKRLLVGGFEKIFEIGRIFRNEGIDQEHLQEYTQMEFYWAYADYEQLMDFTEEMFKYVIEKTFGTLEIESHGHKVNWGKPWKKLDYFDAFKDATGLDLATATIDDLRTKAGELKLKPEANIGKGRLIDLIYKKTVRPNIIEPTHLIHHPIEVSPLSKPKADEPHKTERVQTLAYGTELSNGYSELNDPIDQRARFEEQAKLRAAGDEEAQMMDEDFVEALEYGMPPTAGFGMSERVFSFLVDKPIRETVFFPTMKPEGQNVVGDPTRAAARLEKLEKTVNTEDHELDEFVTEMEHPTMSDIEKAKGKTFFTIDDADRLVKEMLQNKNLQNHCYAAGAAMGALFEQFEVEAERQGTFKDDWIISGMLHDVDYEATDKDIEKHTEVTTEKLREFIEQNPESKDQVERIIQAVRGHANKADRTTFMAKAIYACDELTGLIVAAALVRPDKKLEGLTVDSVLKRYKEPGFAKGADREMIKTAETELDMPLDVFVQVVLDAMKKIHDKIGL